MFRHILALLTALTFVFVLSPSVTKAQMKKQQNIPTISLPVQKAPPVINFQHKLNAINQIRKKANLSQTNTVPPPIVRLSPSQMHVTLPNSGACNLYGWRVYGVRSNSFYYGSDGGTAIGNFETVPGKTYLLSIGVDAQNSAIYIQDQSNNIISNITATPQDGILFAGFTAVSTQSHISLIMFPNSWFYYIELTQVN